MTKLICDLEYLIGRECYNPNSYDGWTGDEGCSYRYKIYLYPDKDSAEPIETKMRINDRVTAITPYAVSTMKYKFGSNHLFIGEGIKKILEELEKRYDLDFNELENKRNT